jgi:hypothetical protein
MPGSVTSVLLDVDMLNCFDVGRRVTTLREIGNEYRTSKGSIQWRICMTL